MINVITKIVCFDLGGTLVHVNKTWGDAYFQARNESACLYHHISLPHRPALWPKMLDSARDADLSNCPTFDLYQAGKISKEEHFLVLQDYLFGSDDDYTFEECLDSAEHTHRHILGKQYSGAFLTLLALLKNSVQIGCLSNTSQMHWDILSDNEEIALMQHNALSFEIGCNKPDLKAFRAFEKMSYTRFPDEVLYFDDVQANVDAANAAGWDARLVVSDSDKTIPDIRNQLIEHGLIQV